jgi:hypothetical protein
MVSEQKGESKFGPRLDGRPPASAALGSTPSFLPGICVK